MMYGVTTFNSYLVTYCYADYQRFVSRLGVTSDTQIYSINLLKPNYSILDILTKKYEISFTCCLQYHFRDQPTRFPLYNSFEIGLTYRNALR